MNNFTSIILLIVVKIEEIWNEIGDRISFKSPEERCGINKGKLRDREILKSVVKISSLGTLLRYDSTYKFSGHERTRITTNITARKLALVKYTSESCAWSPRTRACMLRAYYAKSGSCHEPVRAFRFYAKVGTVLTRLNPYTSENRVSKPLTGNSCCICEAGRGKARQGKARQGSASTINTDSPNGSPRGWAVLNFAHSNIRSRFRGGIDTHAR